VNKVKISLISHAGNPQESGSCCRIQLDHWLIKRMSTGENPIAIGIM